MSQEVKTITMKFGQLIESKNNHTMKFGQLIESSIKIKIERISESTV